MSAHFFIAPGEILSPRWQQAFAQAQILDHVPDHLATTDVVWLLLQTEQSFVDIQRLSHGGITVIAMTAIETPREARQSLEAGASGYVHYLAAPQLLQQIAQGIAAGGLWLGADLMRQLVSASARIVQPDSYSSAMMQTSGIEKSTIDMSLLSLREKAVADLVAKGKSNKEVARELDITERTVKAHLGAIFEKLKVRDRLQLALVLAGKVGV